MKIKWEYPLPTSADSDDYQYESPILINGDYLYYVSDMANHQTLHIIHEETGQGFDLLLHQSIKVIPSKYVFFLHNDITVIYAGDLHFIDKTDIIKTLLFAPKGKVTSHLRLKNHLYVTCVNGKNASLWCIDLEQQTFAWSMNITNTKPYRSGELFLYGELLSCFGQDKLLFINPENGDITNTIHIPRIDKLFCPIPLDDDFILIGYTNWTNAGILKYQLSTQQVIWRHKRKFEGPQLNCKIYLYEGTAFWVKNNTELLALNTENGEEIFCHRTSPWLYTDLQFIDNGILYGTAGANGYLNYIDCNTGIVNWSAFIQNGCAYYAINNHSVFTGGFDKAITQFTLSDGTILDKIILEGEVIGHITVTNRNLYTVICGTEKHNIRLIRIQI